MIKTFKRLAYSHGAWRENGEIAVNLDHVSVAEPANDEPIAYVGGYFSVCRIETITGHEYLVIGEPKDFVATSTSHWSTVRAPEAGR